MMLAARLAATLPSPFTRTESNGGGETTQVSQKAITSFREAVRGNEGRITWKGGGRRVNFVRLTCVQVQPHPFDLAGGCGGN